MPQDENFNNVQRIIQTVKTLNLIKVSSVYYKEVDKNFNENEIKPVDENSVKECLICCSQDNNSVLMTCGHGGVCNTCAFLILKKNTPCHICRAFVSSVAKISSSDKNLVVCTEVGEKINRED